MPKRIWIIPLALLICLGCADEGPKYTEEELAQIPQPIREDLPSPTGGFTLAVGSETITSEDIVGPLLPRLKEPAQQMSFEQFANQAMPVVAMALRDKIADILLYQQAKNAAPEEVDEQLNKAVEAQMRRFIVNFDGDYARAEAFLRDYYGMNWQQYRDYQRRMILSSSYLQGKLAEEKPITHSEVRQYYQQNIDEYRQEPTITIRLIDIDISKAEPQSDESTKEETAYALGEEIMRQINAGEDFSTLAMKHSHGYRASAGGLWDPAKPQSLAEPYDVLAEKTQNMQIGDVAGPIKAKGHIFIIKLEDKQASDIIPLEQVQNEIQQNIIMQRKRKDYDKVMTELMEEAAISGIDRFAMFCVHEIYQRAKTSR